MPERDDIPQKILLTNTEEDRRVSSEGSLVRFEEDDYAEQTKQKIGEYFRLEIEETSKQSSAVISDRPQLEIFDDGTADSDNGYTAKFPDGQAAEARVFFENQSRSTTFDRDILPGQQNNINSNSEIQASLLLAELRNDPVAIADEVARRIGENASFSPDRKYISDPENQDETYVPETVAGTRRHLIQPRLGAHGPSKLFGSVEVEEGVTPTLTIEQLQNLGCQILLESSGEAFIPSDPLDPGQAAVARATTSTVPGVARLGFRVDSNRFSATQIIQTNVDENIQKPEVEIGLSSTAKPSYGSVNNPYVPFAAVSSGISSVVVGTLLSLTFSEIFILLSELLSDELGGLAKGLPLSTVAPFNADNPQLFDPIEDRKKRLGSYIPKNIDSQTNGQGNFGFALLGLNNTNLLVETQFPYKDSLQEGVKVFFGIDNSGPSNFATGLNSNAIRIAETPGYYNGILRSLVRSVSDPLFDIAGSVIQLGGGNTGLQAAGPSDINPLIGPSSDPTNLLGIISVIKESKFLKFMNILAAMGDIAIKSSITLSDIDAISDTIDNPRAGESGESEIIINPAALHKKNRLSNTVEEGFRGSLAWGANTVRSMFFLNDKLSQAESLYSPETKSFSALSSNRNVKTTSNRRFNQTEVELMERELDAYYVPFYFHDLRTNEIIAFHAFLETVNDSYDVEYNEAEGYGRIGKIYTYKNTNRNIQLSFKVVSTNPNDFSEMWYKINKLMMLLFPQYTAGRAISFDSQKFIQPFSQVPSASPLIRLRVGDLIKGNYSDFDLARLFGVGSESFQINDEARQQDAQERTNLQQAQRQARTSFLNYDFRNGDAFIFAQSIQQIGSTVPRSRIDSIIRQVGESPQSFSDRDRARRSGGRSRQRLPEIPVGARAAVVDASRAANKIYTITFTPTLPGTDGGTQYEIDFSQADSNMITPDPISVLNRARSQPSADPEGSTTNPTEFQSDSNDVRDFFSPDDRSAPGGSNIQGNPIFKGFQSTKGQGLAGVIKNLSFNWDGAVWETEGLNNRAPKWCTIDITFAPVWDLNPGLDSNGNMIGAPYNIGQILNQIKINKNRTADMLADLVRYTSQARVDDDEGEEGDFSTLPNGLV